jgi:hypothetical protein
MDSVKIISDKIITEIFLTFDSWEAGRNVKLRKLWRYKFWYTVKFFRGYLPYSKLMQKSSLIFIVK